MKHHESRYLGFQFRGSGVRYCVDVTRLFRVEQRAPIYILPWSRREILGLCRLQSWWIPVLDLRMFIPDEAGAVGRAVMIAQGEEDFVGFAVDRFIDTFTKRAIRSVQRQDHPYLPFRFRVGKTEYALVDMNAIVKEALKRLWNFVDDGIK